ncbi:MAG TPA: thioredoxin family protein [Chthoniobacterales bacterium]
MRNILSLAFLSLLFSSAAMFAKPGWEENYEKGLEQAKSENKLVLLDFTGSDWCGWCIKLDKEVFSEQKFKDYAKDNLVLVELDFPQNKPQSATLQAQNEKLQEQYQIEGYPTIIVLNSEGKPIGQLGYMPGGPDAFLAELDKLKTAATAESSR